MRQKGLSMYDSLKQLVKTAYGPSYSLPPRQTAAQRPIQPTDLQQPPTAADRRNYSDATRFGTTGQRVQLPVGQPDNDAYSNYIGRAYNPWYSGIGPAEDTTDDVLRWGGRGAGITGLLAGAGALGLAAAPTAAATYATYGAPAVAAGRGTAHAVINRGHSALKYLLPRVQTGYRYLANPRALRHTPLRHVVSPRDIGRLAGLRSIHQGISTAVQTPDLIVDKIDRTYDNRLTSTQKQQLHELISWANAPTVLQSAMTEDTPISQATRELLTNTLTDELRWRMGMPNAWYDRMGRFAIATPPQAAFRLTPLLLSSAESPNYNLQLKNIVKKYTIPTLLDPQLQSRPEYPLLRDLVRVLAPPTIERASNSLIDNTIKKNN